MIEIIMLQAFYIFSDLPEQKKFAGPTKEGI